VRGQPTLQSAFFLSSLFVPYPLMFFFCFFLSSFFQALEALSGECSSRVKGITQTLSANEAHAALKRQVEKDAKAMAAFFNVENASDDIEQTTEVQLLTEKGFTELVCSLYSSHPFHLALLVNHDSPRVFSAHSSSLWKPSR